MTKADGESTTYHVKGSQLVRDTAHRGKVRPMKRTRSNVWVPLSLGSKNSGPGCFCRGMSRKARAFLDPRSGSRPRRQGSRSRARRFQAKGRLMNIHRRRPRRGVALIPALVCLVLVGMLWLSPYAPRTRNESSELPNIAVCRPNGSPNPAWHAPPLASRPIPLSRVKLGMWPGRRSGQDERLGGGPHHGYARPKVSQSACWCKWKPTIPAKIPPRGRAIESRLPLIFLTTDCSGVLS